MTIDATGSLVKNIKYEHTKSKHIFLYQCMSVSRTGSVPIFQMLSAEQDTVAIITWLLKIISDKVPIPRIVVCDFSLALLSGISIAFAHKRDLRDYMQACYDVIIKKSQTLPDIFIRLDVSHLVAIICRWDCLKRHPLSKVRQFYIRIICQAYKMETLYELEQFFEAVLIVAMSPSIGQNLQSQIKYDYVSNIIKGTFSDEGFKSDEETCNNEDIIDLENNCYTGWLEWSKEIYEKATVTADCENGDNVNAFYSIEVANKIKKLMCYVPIWTGILLPFF